MAVSKKCVGSAHCILQEHPMSREKHGRTIGQLKKSLFELTDFFLTKREKYQPGNDHERDNTNP